MKKYILALLASLVLAGCKTTEPLYYHGEYSKAVYSYFKAEDVTLEEQISILQEIIQTAEAKSKTVAPGVHAHLGMLYFETGNAQLGKQHFETEMVLFPESEHYISFLLKSAGV
ncbi:MULTISPECIES: DUF4810 domain-containing protein [Pseudoalteromonas]|uniref:DUF4810 domain-containing protein n=1 Tax=Pseudoalteromonas TaxID=53246 RepID=UPI000FFED6E0|nr:MULTISPECIES: DUF4810 domain-containing protein [unclassified Pseudoalteromonas]MCG9760116.1 DUF4810 domain-containing protein [Pseudoalteromonas sp. Isolate6]RXE87989.1 DUF4810 domain-containing protein [Pseudoalteromonas sp. A757]